jgi:hypothetical protein
MTFPPKMDSNTSLPYTRVSYGHSQNPSPSPALRSSQTRLRYRSFSPSPNLPPRASAAAEGSSSSRNLSSSLSKNRNRPTTACRPCQKRKSRCDYVLRAGCNRCRTLGTPCDLMTSESEERDALSQLLGVSGGGGGPSTSKIYKAREGEATESTALEGFAVISTTGELPNPQFETTLEIPAESSIKEVTANPAASMKGDLALQEVNQRMSRLENMLQQLIDQQSSSTLIHAAVPGRTIGSRSVPAGRVGAPPARREQVLSDTWPKYYSNSNSIKGGWASVFDSIVGRSSQNGYLDPVALGLVDFAEFDHIWIE